MNTSGCIKCEDMIDHKPDTTSSIQRRPDGTFAPGGSGNPRGRPNCGASIVEWINALAGVARSELQSIIDDAAAPVAKVSAARVLIDSATLERSKSGTPIAGAEFDRLLDRTVGRPVQQVALTAATCVEHTIMAKAATDPAALELMDQLAKLLGID